MSQPQRKGSSSGGKGARAKQKNNENGNANGNANGHARTMPWNCSGCDDVIDEGVQSIECHKCKLWSHKSCTELSEAEYRVLERGGESLLWQCNKCINDGGAGNVQATRADVKLDRLLNMFQDMIQRMEKIEGAQMGKSIDQKIEEAVDRKMTEVMDETKEKEQRKLNIIIANLPESNVGTYEEKRREDRDKVKHLVGRITDLPEVELGEAFRLGPVQIGHNVRPRLIKMVIRSEESKSEIMRNVYRLNDGIEFENRVYINNDSTPRERTKYRELKVELLRRVAEGETDLVIRNLQIVKRKARQTNPRN